MDENHKEILAAWLALRKGEHTKAKADGVWLVPTEDVAATLLVAVELRTVNRKLDVIAEALERLAEVSQQ